MRLSEEMRSFLARLAQGKTPVGAGVLEDTQKDQQMFQDTRKAENGNGHAAAEAKTSRAKQLRWKLKSSGIELMTITPALAEAMLEHNSKNRPPKPTLVERYAKRMKAGEWRLTHECIVFSTSGRVQNGQHRLLACVASGSSFQAYVAFGAPDENFAFIDTGGRSASDIFAINGVQNSALMASATRWVMGYDEGRISGASVGLSVGPSHDQLYEFFLKHPRLQSSAKIGQMFASSRLAAPSMMAAMHYICARKNREEADRFFEKVGSSVGLSRNETAHQLHKVLMANTKEQNRKLSSLTIAAYTLKAWNGMRAGKEKTNLAWRGEQHPDESFPKAV